MRNGSPVTGGTSSTLQLVNITTAQAGAYTVEVRNSAGAVLSSSAQVTVRQAPAISTAVAPSAACGGSATFSVTAIGDGTLTYQWKFNGVDIDSATGASL